VCPEKYERGFCLGGGGKARIGHCCFIPVLYPVYTKLHDQLDCVEPQVHLFEAAFRF